MFETVELLAQALRLVVSMERHVDMLMICDTCTCTEEITFAGSAQQDISHTVVITNIDPTRVIIWSTMMHC
jgi:hypothetical protein